MGRAAIHVDLGLFEKRSRLLSIEGSLRVGRKGTCCGVGNACEGRSLG